MGGDAPGASDSPRGPSPPPQPSPARGEGEKWPWWLGAGLAAGLALLSKYTAALPVAGVFVFLLTSRAHRPWLARPQPWVAAIVAALAFAPVLAWNASHGWASFAFQGGRAAAARFHPFGPLAAFAGEAAFLLPWIWVGLAFVFLRALRRGPADGRGWLALCLAAGPILLFAIVSLWVPRILFHWAAPGYLFLFPALGAWIAEHDGRTMRRIAQTTAALLVAGLAVVAVEVRFDSLPLAGDPALQAVDWTPLRPALAARGLLDRPIAATGWAEAGKIGYALGPSSRVLCLNVDAREFGYAPGPAAHLGQDIVIVAPRRDLARMRADYGRNFASIEELPPLVVDLPGRPATEFPLFLGRDLRVWP